MANIIRLTSFLACFLAHASCMGQELSCNVLVTITSGDSMVLVNRSISRTCLQCVDEGMQSYSGTVWVLPRGRTLSSTSNPSPEELQLLNGMLVLLHPMQLLVDGNNAYSVACLVTSAPAPFNYEDIEVFSSTFTPPTTISNIAVEEGDNVSAVCSDPNPPPLRGSQIWLDPTGQSYNTFAVLNIYNISRTQAGDYHCELNSSRGEVLSTSLTITVLYPPVITSEDSPIARLLPGTSITLSCVFSGVPRPTVTWHHNGRPLDPEVEDGVAVMISTRGNRSELILPKDMEYRESLFVCTASNSRGNSSTNITVLSLPEPVLGLTTSTSDTSISLEWSYQSSGSSERTGVVVELWAGGVLMESVGLSRVVTSTTLSFLRPLTNYTIAVYVVSEVGRSAPITVYTTLSLRLPAPNITTFRPHSLTRLYLEWEHPVIELNSTTPPTGWSLELSLSSGELVERRSQHEGNSTSARFTGLEPGTEYRVRVAGENTRGPGEFSTAVSTSTESILSTRIGVALLTVIATLALMNVVIPTLILVCACKLHTRHSKQGKGEPAPATLQPCAAYGMFSHSCESSATTHSGVPFKTSGDSEYAIPHVFS